MARQASVLKEIEITPAMVVAGVERMRKSRDEGEQSLADFSVVLGILDTALAVQRGGHGSFLTPASRQQILADSLQCL